MTAPEPCAGCGLRLEGDGAGCQALFDRLSSRTDWVSYPARRMAIDTYCLQHPDAYCASAKSLAAHLTGLCWALEFGGRESGLAALQRWLNGPRPLTRPALPAARGEVTIGEVAGAAGAADLDAAVQRWARSAWAAYGGLHELARAWVREALGSRS